MKKLNLLIGLLVCNVSLGQSIPNAGFEDWTPQGQFENPDNWTGPKLIVKSTDMNSGSFAIQIEAGLFTNPQTQQTDTVPGRAVTGEAGGGMGNPGTEGYAFTSRPDSLTGWFKYVPNGVDECIMKVTLTEWNTGTSSKDTIATGIYVNSSNPNYSRFSFGLDYISANTPDTCVIELMSSDPTSDILNSILTVDDLAFVTNTNSLNENDFNELIEIYPNPSSDIITINGVDEASFVIYDINGSEVMKLENCSTIDLTGLPKGNYLLKIQTVDGEISKKIIKL